MTAGVKVPSSLTKKECLQELASFQVPVTNDLSIQELRALVKNNRVNLGLMVDRRAVDNSLMNQVEKGNLGTLKSFANQHQVGFPTHMELGELRLHLRKWVVRNGRDETLIHFGKHHGKCFHQVWQKDSQYVAWSVKEAVAQPEAHWRLVQLATWAVLSGKVPDPYSEEMHVENARNQSLPPTALATILELDDSIFNPQEYTKKATPVLSLAAGHSRKNDQKAEVSTGHEASKEDLLKQVQVLRQEIRALKESKGTEELPHSRKAAKDESSQ